VAAVQYTFTHKHPVAAVQYTFTHKHPVAAVQYTFIYTQTPGGSSTHLHIKRTQNTENETYITIKKLNMHNNTKMN
jgi:hypothetical protein